MSDSPTDAADDSSTDAADAAALAALHEEFGTVVYDLDGTLVDLTVDWGAVADDVIAVYEDAGVTPPGDGWGPHRSSTSRQRSRRQSRPTSARALAPPLGFRTRTRSTPRPPGAPRSARSTARTPAGSRWTLTG